MSKPQKNTQTAARRTVSKKARRKRKRNKFVVTLLLLIFVIATVIVLSLTVFFGIAEITVVGDYDAQLILGYSKIEQGDNLFLVSEKDIRANILSVYQDADMVSITKKLPGTVQIEVKKGIPATAFYNNGSYAIISERGRLLAKGQSEIPEGVVKIEGVTMPENALPGEFVDTTKQDGYAVVQKIFDGFKSYGIQGVTCIRVTDKLDIQAVIGTRLIVKLGTYEELDYKVKFASNIIKNQIGETETGTVDASIIGKVNFIPLRSGEVIQ